MVKIVWSEKSKNGLKTRLHSRLALFISESSKSDLNKSDLLKNEYKFSLFYIFLFNFVSYYISGKVK
jgi:hypothetical protein